MNAIVTGRKIKAKYRIVRFTALVLLLLISAILVFAVWRYRRDDAEQQLSQKAAETLAVQTEILSGVLEKYRLLPPLLTRQNDIASLFTDERPWPERFARAQIKAEEVAGMSGAREVAFLWPDGSLLASARGIYKPGQGGAAELTEAARQGRLGRSAVSLNNSDRAYAFSSGVRRGDKLIGVIVVYVGFEGIEATWSLSTNPIYVSENSGTVILTNRPAWRLKTTDDLAATAFSEKRYANLGRELTVLDWQLHVLSDTAPARASAAGAAATAGLICLFAGIAVMMILNRREMNERQLRKDRALSLRLERIVRDRTRALSLTNESLSHEVEERKQAEDKLRTAQAELIQTAKLAVLGQMAATLSHEMNQPLAAMQTYASNARRFLELNRAADAVSTLKRITAMVDRMAELSGALLSFSRKPGTEKRQISLSSAIDEAMILVRPRATREHIALVTEKNYDQYQVMGGRIRLSQVFVNLINNAIDALRGQKNGEVHISARMEGSNVVVTISDNGPGIPENLRGAIFDPFFTTKPAGEGIGVGLSIVYNIVQDFGGSIRLLDDVTSGTTFEITLMAANGD
jgi:two-component system, NtrC family, C4-dicarboxylate transport sensor histidine kinase DctB